MISFASAKLKTIFQDLCPASRYFKLSHVNKRVFPLGTPCLCPMDFKIASRKDRASARERDNIDETFTVIRITV